ncbi:uncharacterized protein COLE_05545 [Cutaneotrichosporon oleaginosum]|uniref:uncharacterized protein n=1 Tax=Cutaneotrichosporon oleaginosum TaxID=879819 RepID=UPI001325C976|nr:hypothetical protein COLE_05545 [Cutaneotrichosporon oleaginosum]
MPPRPALARHLRAGLSRPLSVSARAAHAGCSTPHAPPSSSSASTSASASPSSSSFPSSTAASHAPSPANPAGARETATAGGRTHRTPGAPLNAPVGAGGPGDNAAYCASLVQRLDPDAWLTSYFWPRREREWWLAMRAFNPAIAAMRFQFWRDALAAVFGGKPVPQHPVALALASVHAARPVQRYYLGQLIEVRVRKNADSVDARPRTSPRRLPARPSSSTSRRFRRSAAHYCRARCRSSSPRRTPRRGISRTRFRMSRTSSLWRACCAPSPRSSVNGSSIFQQTWRGGTGSWTRRCSGAGRQRQACATRCSRSPRAGWTSSLRRAGTCQRQTARSCPRSACPSSWLLSPPSDISTVWRRPTLMCSRQNLPSTTGSSPPESGGRISAASCRRHRTLYTCILHPSLNEQTWGLVILCHRVGDRLALTPLAPR